MVFIHFVAMYICVFVGLWVYLSGAFGHEGVELGSPFLVGKLMGTPKGAK